MSLTKLACCNPYVDIQYNELVIEPDNKNEYAYKMISVTDSNASEDEKTARPAANPGSRDVNNKPEKPAHSETQKRWNNNVAKPLDFLLNPDLSVHHPVSCNDDDKGVKKDDHGAGQRLEALVQAFDSNSENVSSLDGNGVDQDFIRKSLQRRAAASFQRAIFHAGTFETIKFKANVFQKARIMLDLEKNPPKLDQNQQPFKVHMDKCNILDSDSVVHDLQSKSKCCVYRMSFLKTHWLAICMDPGSLNGTTEREIIKTGRYSRLARNLKCENETDVINAVFCIHLCTLRGFKFTEKTCFIQHLLNKRLYACAAIVNELPEGRNTEKIQPCYTQPKAPWFDMENDVMELSLRVRSRHEDALTLYMQNANARAPKRQSVVGQAVENEKEEKVSPDQKSDVALDIAPWLKPAVDAKAKPKAKAKTKSRIGYASVGFNAD